MDTPQVMFLEKLFRQLFETKVHVFFCYDLQVRQNIEPFSFFEKNGNNHLFSQGDPQVMFLEK